MNKLTFTMLTLLVLISSVSIAYPRTFIRTRYVEPVVLEEQEVYGDDFFDEEDYEIPVFRPTFCRTVRRPARIVETRIVRPCRRVVETRYVPTYVDHNPAASIFSGLAGFAVGTAFGAALND